MCVISNTEGPCCNHCCSGKINKHHIFWVRVCSLRYPVCYAYASYCHQWPARLYPLFLHISQTGPASWLGGQSFWLLTMWSRDRFPALPCAFFLEGGRRPWWPWSYRDNVTAPTGLPNFGSRLHFSDSRVGGRQRSLRGHVVALEGGSIYMCVLLWLCKRRN